LNSKYKHFSKEASMYRKFLLILAAIVGVAFAPNAASAARGGFRGGGFRGGVVRGGGFRGGRGFGFAGPALGLGLGLGLAGAGYYGGYYGGYGGYPYYGYGGCWQNIAVDTPWGPRIRRIWVCD
jgi:hypothetical protein